MKNARRIAAEILHYFKNYPGVGHTRTVIQGAQNTRSILVVTSRRGIKGIKDAKVQTLEDVADGALRDPSAAGWPLALDNDALVALLTALVKEEKHTIKKEKVVTA